MLQIMICCHRSVKGGYYIIIKKYFPYSQFQRKLEVRLVCLWDVCSSHCSTKAPEKKDIAFKEGYTFCNNNVYVEFSDTFSMLHGQLYLIFVLLFATFPHTDVFPGQLMKHYLIVCAIFPFHALADHVYLTWFLAC
jgi:hypothetical protein